MDLENVLDELYALRPQDFTAARDERAAAARREGERELARRIRALPRPTVSAWAANLLARREPERIEPLTRLGEGLREAHRNLDGEQLRTLGRQQHQLVGALAREARRLAAEAGQSVGDAALHEVENTLLAVLADPEAARAWAAGHLERPLSAPVGFTGLAPGGAGAVAGRTRPPAGDTAGPPAGHRGHGTREKTRDREEGRRQERSERLDRARRDAEAARREADAGERRRDEATVALERARSAHEEAHERVVVLTAELKEAERLAERTESALRDARENADAADREARTARRRADEAAKAAERLFSAGSS